MKKIETLIKKTYKASVALRTANDRQVKQALKMLADAVEENSTALLNANRKDVSKQDVSDPRTDRLMLNEQRIKNIANSIRKVAKLPNPTGKVLEKRTLPNGLQLEKVTVPLGVVGAIYESRPNVTFDIAALCLRSFNGCLLKGSSEAEYTNRAAITIIKKVLKENNLPPDCITLLPSERETVQELFTATKYVDVLIPRGSDKLIEYVRKNSLVPVIETGAGVCHVYVEKEAALDKALNIVVNAKVSRPSVCNAMDTVVVDKAIAPRFLKALQPQFIQYEVELFADAKAYPLLKGYPHLQKAKPADFGREFLSLKCAVKVVNGIDEALQHIQDHSTRHSEAIVSENKKQCQRFVQEVDAAAVYTNASTRFTDGEEFGLGAEIGISTQKLHARGPFALEKLVTEKWIIKGSGQVR
ncbi:MAG: glutamate-5-semialdehyde dehydrogenase [Flavisolibacter sp.]|nr:glutamate-5-semialdehyde dehydrogenase [Flavisolibacter sp.]